MAYTYDGCCGSCIYMNTNDYTGSKDHCYCTYRRQYYNLTESKCYAYRYDPNKDYYDLNHRWHVVSAIFKKLGLYEAEFECIQILNNFRVEVLEKDARYEDMLREYDVVGPALANFITNDSNSVELCKKICSVCLLDILYMIKEEKYTEALDKYKELIELLKDYYRDQLDAYFEEKRISGTK